jgi:hypothetical protein
MKPFLNKLALFLIILVVFSCLISYAIDNGLKKTQYSYFGVWNDLYDSEINADLLVMGSSRARQHFATPIMDSMLNLNSYVIGIEGYRFKMMNDIFYLYLQHNKKPKYLIISLDGYTLHEDHNSYYYQQFLPYLTDENMRNLYRGYIHSFSIADYYLPLYKYRGERTQIAVGITEFLNLRKYPQVSAKGYSSLNKEWDGTFDDYAAKLKVPRRLDVDANDVSILANLISFCKTNNIIVILVYSPEYSGIIQITSNQDSIQQIYNKIAQCYGINYLDFINDTISRSKNLFYNSQHLNIAGAKKFSTSLANKISEIILYKGDR